MCRHAWPCGYAHALGRSDLSLGLDTELAPRLAPTAAHQVRAKGTTPPNLAPAVAALPSTALPRKNPYLVPVLAPLAPRVERVNVQMAAAHQPVVRHHDACGSRTGSPHVTPCALRSRCTGLFLTIMTPAWQPRALHLPSLDGLTSVSRSLPPCSLLHLHCCCCSIALDSPDSHAPRPAQPTPAALLQWPASAAPPLRPYRP